MPRAHRRPQDQLRLAVQRLRVVGDHRHRLDRVDHLVRDQQVDAQRDLVAGHDFLTRDVGHLLAAVDRLPRDLARALPEHVQARGSVPT